MGLDLDLEALQWCMENNISNVGADAYSRISLLHGNVLQPLEAEPVAPEPHKLVENISLTESNGNLGASTSDSVQDGPTASADSDSSKRNSRLPARDIICAFNYSCCCLHKRSDLVLYFKHVLEALSNKGGIFVMDLYGGTSSERKLKLQRRFAKFTVLSITSNYTFLTVALLLLKRQLLHYRSLP